MNNHLLNEFLGLHASSHTISTGQMCARAVVVFFWALFLLRLAGKRAFGSGSAMDMVLKVIFGAVLSRAVVAASPFWATLATGAVFVVLHRLLRYAAFFSQAVDKIIKGERKVLVQDGQLQQSTMRQTSVSENDILEGMRNAAQLDSLDQAKQVSLERNGQISVVKKQQG